jgi:methyltransferase FkbM-like protein
MRTRRLPLGIARGIRLEIDFRHQTKLYLGLYEIELNRHLRRLCRAGFRAFDVGGQFGYDALVFAKLTGAPVVSFERDEACLAVMGRNFASNPKLAPLLEARRAFVTDKTNRGALALDDFASEWGTPDFIKIDVEGGEVDVLRGAARLLRDLKPGALVEVHSPQLERDCSRILVDAGYSITVVDQRRWLRDQRPTTHNRWLVAEGRKVS